MKVLILSTYDITGGAARAATRLRNVLRTAGVDCRMWVLYKHGDSPYVVAKHSLRSLLGGRILHRFLGKRLLRRQKSGNRNLRSLSLFGSGLVDEINRSDADVVHLHWVQLEMLSIRDIALIRKPLVWTLHDMWAFCGAEHVCDDDLNARWRSGYTKDSRQGEDCGLDLDRWTWLRKRKYWNTPIQIVAPSQWLADCVKASELMCDWPVEAISNPLDVSVYRPWPKQVARELFGFPQDKPLILFGAWGGAVDSNKGGDLLRAALPQVRASVSDAEAIILGQSRPEEESEESCGMAVHYTGLLRDDTSLAMLYSAADVMVVPSRIENAPQSALEAQACGTPVVCFDKSGLKNAVLHGTTGLRVTPYSVEELAEATIRMLLDEELRYMLSRNAPKHAVRLCDPSQVANQYRALYQRVCSH